VQRIELRANRVTDSAESIQRLPAEAHRQALQRKCNCST
jgi:hypothetical protein